MVTRSSLDERGEKLLWISWSRLATWSKCQQKAILQMEHKSSVIKEGRNFISGTVADRAVRQWLEQDEPHLPGQMQQYVDDLWVKHTRNSEEYKVTFKSPEDEVNAKKLASEAVLKLEPFLIQRVLPFEFQAEWKFNLQIKVPDFEGNLQRSVILNGGSDIVVRDPDTGMHYIYDLKVTRNENYVLGPTMAQLIYYQIALHLAEGVEFDKMHSAFLTPACKIQYHPLEVGSEDRRILMSRIVTMAQSVWRKDTPTLTANTGDCYWCAEKSFCPRFCSPAKEVNGKHLVSFTDVAKIRKDAKERTE